MRVNVGLARLSVRHEDGWYGFQPDYLGGDDSAQNTAGGGMPLESLHPYGFMSCPREPDADTAGKATRGCTLVYGWDGSDGWSLPTQDPRDFEILPTVRPGESLVYGSRGQFFRVHEDGSVSAFTTHDGTVNGQSVYLMLSPTESGKPWTGGLAYVSPWGRIVMGPAGLLVDVGGKASISVTSMSGGTFPLDAVGSQISLQADAISLSAKMVDIGTDNGAGNHAAVLALDAFAAAVGEAVAASSDPGMAPHKATVAAALAAFLAASSKLGKFG